MRATRDGKFVGPDRICDIIVVEADRDARLFMVTKGRVKAFVTNGEGRHKMVRDLVVGDFFGESRRSPESGPRR